MTTEKRIKCLYKNCDENANSTVPLVSGNILWCEKHALKMLRSGKER